MGIGFHPNARVVAQKQGLRPRVSASCNLIYRTHNTSQGLARWTIG